MKTCENVDSAKIKCAFYTTDIDILRVASMHRIVISIHIDESLHPYSVPPELKKKACHRDVFIFLVRLGTEVPGLLTTLCTPIHLFEEKYSKNEYFYNLKYLFPYFNTHRSNLLLWCKAEFFASLLQSSVSHDPSEIILICWFRAQQTSYYYQCWKGLCHFTFCVKTKILWFIEVVQNSSIYLKQIFSCLWH